MDGKEGGKIKRATDCGKDGRVEYKKGSNRQRTVDRKQTEGKKKMV